MDFAGRQLIEASCEHVYLSLNDPEVLKTCIPGCESLERLSDDEWRAVLAVRIGSIAARFDGKVQLTDLNPPVGYTINFRGQGATAGFANGKAHVTLNDIGNGQTELRYAANAQVGGKLAQLGSRLVDGAAAKLTEDFFSCFKRKFSVPQVALQDDVASPESVLNDAQQSGPDPAKYTARPVALYAAVIVITLLALLYYLRVL